MSIKTKIILSAVLIAVAGFLLYRSFVAGGSAETATVKVSSAENDRTRAFIQTLEGLARDDNRREFAKHLYYERDMNILSYMNVFRELGQSEFLKVDANKTDPGIRNIYFRRPDGKRLHISLYTEQEPKLIACYVYNQ